MDNLNFIAILGSFWLFHLLAVISPGPSLIVVTQTAISISRRAGVANALGFGIGSLIWAIAAIFGLGILFSAVPLIYAIVKAAGALYLIFLAFKLLRSDGIIDPVADNGTAAKTGFGAFRTGLFIQLSNPKVVIFMGSILTTLLPQSASPVLLAWVLTIIFLNEFLWYSLVATMFSIDRVRAFYAKVSKTVDHIAGLFLGALGIRILTQ